MALTIRNERAARRTSEPVDKAVTVALEERMSRYGQPQLLNKPDPERVRALLAKIDSLPDLDRRAPAEILGYDDLGLP